MANIDEEVIQITGKKWRRARVVTITNEYGSPPVIAYAEDMITVDGVGTVIKNEGCGSLEIQYGVNSPFPLIHPTTGATIGEGTDEGLAVYVYSKYVADRTAENARLAALAAANISHGDGASVQPGVEVVL